MCYRGHLGERERESERAERILCGKWPGKRALLSFYSPQSFIFLSVASRRRRRGFVAASKIYTLEKRERKYGILFSDARVYHCRLTYIYIYINAAYLRHAPRYRRAEMYARRLAKLICARE